MTKEHFYKIIDNIRYCDDKCNRAFQAGVDLINFTGGYHSIIDGLLTSIFDKEKVGILYWYLYEYKEGEMKIYDQKTSEVLYDFDKEGDLWKYMNDKGESPF